MTEPREIVITDVRIPMSSLIVLMLKFAVVVIVPVLAVQALVLGAVWWWILEQRPAG